MAIIGAMAKSNGDPVHGCVVLIVVVGLGWLFFTRSCTRSEAEINAEKVKEAQEERRLTPGYIGHLRGAEGGKAIPLGDTSKDYDELSKAIEARDDIGFRDLIVAGKAFLVDAGTEVKMLDYDWGKVRVRILEGDHKDEAGWTADEFLK